ncbi:MAG: hypothetical protein ACOCUI_05420 [bacterium]
MIGEIFDVLSKKEGKREALEMLQGLIEDIEGYPNLVKIKLSEIAIEEGYCPECFNLLIINSHPEYRGEYMGFPAYEDFYEAKCPKCGHIE